ncbi:MAG TPA: OmpA family protein [Candidatus Angelobacter sp.]|nr:OmpA family protein [Candidatus Angelobacter sp.]
MAVSQFLRPGSLMDAVQRCLTPDVVRSASSLVSEPESATRQTLNGVVPTVLGGLTNLASSRDGASQLAGLIRDGGYGAAADNPRALFGGGNATTSMLSNGQQLLGQIFGSRSSSIADALGKSGGVRSASATKLFSLGAPLVMGVLAKRATAQGLNASGLASTLMGERADIAEALPAGVSNLVSGPSVVASRTEREVPLSEPTHLEHHPEPAVMPEAHRRGGRSWLPLLLAGLAALVLLLFLRARGPRSVQNTVTQGTAIAREALSRIDLPGGANISVPQGSINYNLARFLGDNAQPAPKTFVFDHLNFESASSRLTPESSATVNDLATVLKAYPNSQVELVGHTDNTGTPEANQTLSLSRANAVKTMLVNSGVVAERISTKGAGQDQPVASNDTEEGRARNRRLELNVTSK